MDEQGSQENPPATPTSENATPTPAPDATTESTAPAAPAAPAAELNKIDLSALSGFSFGTQWSTAGDSKRERGGERRDDRRDGGGGGRRDGAFEAPRRDRRPDRRPAGAPGGGSDFAAAASAPVADAPRPPQGERSFRGPDRRDGGFNRGPAHGGGQGGGQGGPGGDRPFRGPRQDFGGPRGDRPPRFEGGDRGPRFGGGRPMQDNRPYLSPFFEIQFFAEDNAFVALVKAVRGSCHTYELFEIARVVLGKSERFVVVVHRTADGEGKRNPVFFTPVDGLPFENEDEAVQHVLRGHLDKFFDMAEVEIEAPKGNFQFVNRCSITGELLAPPNYHRYQHILQQHHASRLANMPFDRFRERIETVKDPEQVAKWLEKMKKTTRYTWKTSAPLAEGQTATTFDSLEDARTYLLAHARDKVVRSQESVRFHGRGLETLPDGEIRRAIEGQLERQRRFPLDTANSLRGRLRREGFTIFKRGSKGVSFVCSVKRKFRLPGQAFSDSIGGLISYVETNPLVSVKELPAKHLGIQQPEAVATTSSAAAPAEGAAAPTLSADDQAKLKRLWMDLRWLVTEGYVTEYSDGKLFAPPPLTAQQQKSEDAANAAADAAEDAARAKVGGAAPGEAAPVEAAPVEAEPAAEVAPAPAEEPAGEAPKATEPA